ncbi:MAG: hypothetical protein VYC34_06595 [Planctomycetota bacterium]|nr:hypothetical protein [Planctomycetota bacterium]
MNQQTSSRRRVDTGAAALWASAFVILALIVSQAGRLPGVNPAYAGNVSEVGDLTILTADSGDNEDILCILDNRSEKLFIYGVQNRQSVELFQTYNLSQTFTDARRAAGR